MRKLFCLNVESTVSSMGDSWGTIKPIAIIEADSESEALTIAMTEGLATKQQVDSERAMAPQISAQQAMEATWIKTRLYKAS